VFRFSLLTSGLSLRPSGAGRPLPSGGRAAGFPAFHRRIPRLCVLAALAVISGQILCGCGAFEVLRTQNEKTQSDVKALSKQVEAVQKSVDELNLAQGGSTSKMKADLTMMLTQLEGQITRLHAEIDETQYRLTQLSAKIEKLDQKKIVMGGATAGPSGSATAAPGSPPGTAAAAAPGNGEAMRVVDGLDLEALFNQARDDYIRGKYDLALSGFKTVYEKDAGGTWRELAMFWLGETLLKQDKADKALEAYARVVREFPRGTKACSAHFKIGLIYNDKKDKAKRDEEWGKLIAECAGTNEAQRAQEIQKE
jgi:TolA-binding protein